MTTKTKRVILWGLTAAAAAALGIFEIVGQPDWWAGAIVTVAAVVGVILGKPWKIPNIDE